MKEKMKDAVRHLEEGSMLYDDEVEVLNGSLNDFLKEHFLGICRKINIGIETLQARDGKEQQ